MASATEAGSGVDSAACASADERGGRRRRSVRSSRKQRHDGFPCPRDEGHVGADCLAPHVVGNVAVLRDHCVRLRSAGGKLAETRHETEAGRRGIDDVDAEIGPGAAEGPEHFPDIAGPPGLRSFPRSLAGRSRKTVVEENDSRIRAVPLDVAEVTHRVLEEVHPVDERQVDWQASEVLRESHARKELVGGRAFDDRARTRGWRIWGAGSTPTTTVPSSAMPVLRPRWTPISR